jgi:aminopeptidase N
MVRRAALVITAVLSSVLAATPAVAGPGGTPGAPGIGDPYFPLDGNGGYDVKHYGLAIKYTPETDVLAGTATIRARATQNLSAFNLDFEGLTIRSVTVDGRRAQWSRSGAELTVTPRRTLRNGHTFVTKVVYDGIPQIIRDPNLGDAGVFATDDGVTIIGQPDVAATWFPVNDHPIDKASYDIDVTVPAGLEAVSNGLLAGRSTRNGWTTWRWEAREPMASYLATATVGQFDLRKYRAGGITYIDALDPALPADIYRTAAASFARQPEIVKFLAQRFGRYPFSASGGIVDNNEEFGYALENQTRPIYAPGFFDSQESGDAVVVHELAHMWYGDSLAVARWSDIWLNEAFASYAEWMWSEDQGLGTAQEIFNQNYARPATSAFWTLRIGDPGADHLFDGPVYDRGAMTMHALRLTVGDAKFFRILRSWAQQNRGGNVTTAQFIAHAERVSGQQLDDLFNAWLFTPSKPPAPAA